MLNRKIYLLLGVLAFLLTLIYIFPRYTGDGDLLNNGWFRLVGYHYEIGFDEIAFKDEAVNIEYKLSGVPFQNYDFELRITPPDVLRRKSFLEIQPFYNTLYESELDVKVLLMEGNKQIYELGGGLSSDHWVLSNWRFYLSSSNHRFSRYSLYTLQVLIQSQKPLEDEVVFQPYLLGGYYRVF